MPWDEQGDTIKTQIDVNVTGALYCAAHALRHMVAQRSGSLVNIASRGIMGQSGMAVYSARRERSHRRRTRRRWMRCRTTFA